ncbi:MAG: hypothetical protein EZS28_035564 [Streblomastix strix]|uniref:Uncharacterized protein n=1 Tax=Streblomastix strix TaxID=222440 RepID=A0A5J4UE33_9EUKA|nr:MAG: hypothetical protein EZS28_035564 [Streblomastix strix]
MLEEYKTKPLTSKSIFVINGNHYIVGAVGSGPDETMAINMNDKGVQLTNMTYNEAMIFLPYQPTKISRYSIPPLIQHVVYEKRLKIVDTHEIDEDGVEIIKTLKLPVLSNAKLLSTLMIFDDIGSNTDIQRYTSELSRTITHLVSDSRHAKNTLFFVAQRPSYLFKTARILCHVIVIGSGISDNDLKQVYEENHINTLTEQELMIIYNTLNKAYESHTYTKKSFGKLNQHYVLILTCPFGSMKQSMGIRLSHTTGVVDYLVIQITALRGILRDEPLNFGFAESYIKENSVYPVFQLVLGLECVIPIDIYILSFYNVAYPHVKKSNTPIPSTCYVAYSIVDPTFHTPSVSVGSALQPVRTKLSQFALFFINLRPQLRISSFGSIIIQPIA